jgi:hypothetical protein
MPTVDLQTLRVLSEKGVSFCIAVPDAWSLMNYWATPEDLVIFADDETALYAKAHGVTKSEYRDWEDDLFCAYCAATTRTGRRCRNMVLGGFTVSPRRWLELQGGYCAVHGEGVGTGVKPVTATV